MAEYAWTTLLSHPSYVVGVRSLLAALRRHGSPWPLVVMVTDDIGDDDRRALTDLSCVLEPVDVSAPPTGLQSDYITARFSQTWTKLRAWQLDGYDRVVLLDADMLVRAPMDELFTLDLGGAAMAAAHACRCNPEKVTAYPADWTPEKCHYTWVERGVSAPATVDDYFNSGLMVLTPDPGLAAAVHAKLSGAADISAYRFSEQDFLNEWFAGRWLALPYTYNALKTLSHQHPAMWRLHDVKNIHYILDKPWDRDPASLATADDRYAALDRLWWDAAPQRV